MSDTKATAPTVEYKVILADPATGKIFATAGGKKTGCDIRRLQGKGGDQQGR